jgi:hypothetical protein
MSPWLLAEAGWFAPPVSTSTAISELRDLERASAFQGHSASQIDFSRHGDYVFVTRPDQ